MSDRAPSSPQLTSLLSRLGVVSPGRPSHSEALCIVASITNLTQVESAHGSALASMMRRVVRERARQVCETDAGILTTSGDHLLFVFEAPSRPNLWGEMYAPRPTVLLERILSALGDCPVRAGQSTVFPVIHATIAPWTDGPFDITAVGASAVTGGRGGREWRERYVADMQVAEKLFHAMNEERLCFEWEPVQEASGASPARYFEALLCKIDDGVVTRVGRMIPALERLGLVRRLDQWVVEAVIEALRVNRNLCLGCNVSAQSATLDPWWAFIVATLREAPDIASRLVIEITETAPLTALAEARAFVRSLQSLGCRVALDDVGTGHGDINTLVDLGVDIAKIDAVYLRQAGQGARGAERLRQLVGFAKTCATSIVIEGVENETEAAISRSSGADWLQGYLFPKATPFDVKPSAGRRRGLS